MSMTKEAIEYVVELGTVETKEIGTQTFSTQPLSVVKEPTAREIVLRSLSGLVGYVKSEFDKFEPLIIHVENPTTVSCFTTMNGNFNRSVLIRAEASIPHFRFSNFHDREEFNINLQSGFVPSIERDIVLKVVGTIAETSVREIGDDGVSQAVTAKVSVGNRENVKVPNPVELRPYRTFVEVEQPESKFIFRMKEGAYCGLFEADGGAWKLEAMNNIKGYLNEALAQEIESKKVFVLA
ncbi:TPA: hypothetical protein QCW01_001544 [Bacillus thuringiensis]|nr:MULTISPECIES: hypothetical protein [Bacillus cereus group]KLA14637.1 hypothetical protein B4158_4440 [Bacillus cereus]MCC3935431.1 hypothetical protein [Bacillus thuringiensis]MCC3954098.1 hypothetical protein [Bacillus thuringiensis]MCU4918928.1 hypothetical protein [Bacillus cereus]MDA2541889.1 hypothetical protein [Bacillus cereus]